MYRSGIGYDTHRLVRGRPLILGGVTVPFPRGLQGHSDADVLTHAVMDALLGAAGLGDIGVLFPDTDSRYTNANSMELLRRVRGLIEQSHYTIKNIDSVVICERPRLRGHISSMITNISAACGCNAVSVKATTTEGMNAEGKGRCISAQAICILRETRT